MSRKRIVSLVAIFVGLFLTCYALYGMHRIAKAKGIGSDIDNFFNHNPSVWDPMIEFFGGEAQKEISKYDVPVMIMFIAGIVLTVGGVITTIRWRKG